MSYYSVHIPNIMILWNGVQSTEDGGQAIARHRTRLYTIALYNFAVIVTCKIHIHE